MKDIYKNSRIYLIFAALGMAFSPTVEAENTVLQADRTLYVTRCTQCHALEMASSPNYLLPSDVMPLIESMRDMPGSQIQNNEVTRLYKMALYNIYENQRDDLKKKLEELTPENRTKEIQAIKVALEQYK